MSVFKQHYGNAEGPLGFPQTDKQARALEAILKALPKDDAFAYRKLAVEKATTEISPGERADVSWISTEDPDRQKDVVLSKGMNDSQFALNPIVTMQHCYHLPPAGRSLWRKKLTGDSGARGIKAKTVYPTLPAGWPEKEAWVPDVCFGLVQQGMMNGKSIGFLPLKVRQPSDKELERWGKSVDCVIEEWLLLEYACVYLPAQQNAVVEEVSKGVPDEIAKVLGIVRKELPAAEPAMASFTSLSEIEKAIHERLAHTAFPVLVRQLTTEQIARLQGRL